MNGQLLVGYAALWLVLFKALFVRAGIIRADCPRCGLGYERRELGGPICTCGR